MKRAILLAGTLFLCFTHIATAQWQFAGVFPDSTTLTNTAHGIGVGGDGSVWIGPYNSTLVTGTLSEVFNPVAVYHSDGSPATFSPIKGWMDADTLRRFGRITGISNDAQGNVWVSAHGFRTNVKSRVNPAQDSIIGGFWNQTRSWIYKFAADGTQLMAKEVTIMRTETSSHAPNRVAVTSNGDAIVSFVFPGSPIKIYAAADLSEMGTVTLDKSGFSRSLEVSPDGKTVFNPNSLFFTQQYVSEDGVLGEYAPSADSTLAAGMDPGSVHVYPADPGILYVSASGSGNNPSAKAPWNSTRIYGISLNSGRAVDSLAWDYGTRTAFVIPRSMAISADGLTMYLGTFSTGTPAVQKFTFQGELPEPPPPPPVIDLESGLVAYYPINGNAQNAVADTMHGQLNHGARFAADRHAQGGASVWIDGVNANVHIADPIFNIGDDYSLTGWFNSIDLAKTYQTVLNTVPHTGIGLQWNNSNARNVFVWGLGPANAYWTTLYERGSGFNMVQNKWHSFVFVKNGTKYRLYMDGMLYHEKEISASANYDFNVGLILGDICIETPCQVFKGRLDDYRIYNRALSEAEVAALYELESTPPPLAADEIQDIDGNRYKTVRIGDQVWMAENLRTTRYQDGSLIPNVTDGGQWSQLSTGAWAFYNNDPALGEIYGKLYNWYAAADERNACPVGWHVPSDEEWTVLSEFLGEDAGFKMKSISGWDNNGNGSNASGFTGLPGGSRYLDGTFYDVGRFGIFWSSSEYNSANAWRRFLDVPNRALYREYLIFKGNGFSIRCVRPYSSQTASSDTWTLPVRATSQTGLTATAYLGVSPSASNGLDSLDIPAPPTPPGEHITVFTNHPEWNSPLGPRVGTDIRASVDLSAVPTSWELTLSSSGAASGTLLLDRPEGLNWPMVVLSGSGRWVSRSGDLSVPFSFTSAGQQVFTVQVGDTTAPELQAGAWFEGPAILDASASHPLDWQAEDQNHLESVSLEVSHDDGASWSTVHSGTGSTTDWTPSAGLVFNESTRFRLTATDRANNVTVIFTQVPVSVMSPRQPVTHPQGWSLSGSPFVSPNTTASMLGDAFRFAWTGAGYEQVTGFTQGRGHWTGALQAVTDTLAGTVATSEQTLSLPAGWNLVASPLLRSVYADSVSVTHGAHGRRLPLTSAIDSNWVTAPLGYTGSGYASSGRVEPFAGYWLGVTVPQGASLTLPIHAYATAQAKESSQSEPLVRLTLRDQDAEQILAIRQGGGVPAPPAAPNGQRIGLKGEPTILGDLYLVAGAKVDDEYVWPLVIGGEARMVELSWTDQSFEGMTAVLDLPGRRYDLTRANTITLRTDEAAQVVTGPVSTSTEPFDQAPLRTELHAAYPNPFNPSTQINYTLDAGRQTRIAVYDLLGREVAVLVNGTMPAGRHRVTFDASGLASGVYVVRLEAGGEVFVRRVTLLK
jgi:uncharacterized protein (TIGR02145 family)